MSRIFHHRRFNPSRGGHAPGELVEAFNEAEKAYSTWADGESEPTVELQEKQVPISQICGLLWNCTDTFVTGEYLYDHLDHWHSGAQAARELKRLIDQRQ